MARHPSRVRRHGEIGRSKSEGDLFFGNVPTKTTQAPGSSREHRPSRGCAQTIILVDPTRAKNGHPAVLAIGFDDKGVRGWLEEGNTHLPRHRKMTGQGCLCPSLEILGLCCSLREELSSFLLPGLRMQSARPPAAERRGAVSKYRAKKIVRRHSSSGSFVLRATPKMPKSLNLRARSRRVRTRGDGLAHEEDRPARGRMPARRNVLQRSVVQARLLRSAVLSSSEEGVSTSCGRELSAR